MPDASSGGGPLAGITVVDLSAVGPASRCTRLLADYGAAVVKVAPVPGRGPEQAAPAWAYAAGRGTRRACIDLRHPDGRDALLALARQADVFVESFRPGVAERLGIGYDHLRSGNPGIVYVSTSGYGRSGPRAAWAGHDLDYLAVGGFLGMCEPAAGGGPPLPGATIADAAAGGMQAAMAVCATLLRRTTTGEGAHLDVSVADGVLWLMSLAVEEHLATGERVAPGHDVLSGRYACYGTYAAADGRFLAVAAIEPKFFANLCQALDCASWADKQYDDDCQEELRAALAAAFATRRRDDWVEVLAFADTCVAPVLAVDEVAADAHFAARGALVEAVEPSGRRLRQVGAVLAGMMPLPDPVPLPGPDPDTEALLLGAGMPADAVAALRDSGVVA
jgi:alpha-methylacyl-CoA racemase